MEKRTIDISKLMDCFISPFSKTDEYELKVVRKTIDCKSYTTYIEIIEKGIG